MKQKKWMVIMSMGGALLLAACNSGTETAESTASASQIASSAVAVASSAAGSADEESSVAESVSGSESSFESTAGSSEAVSSESAAPESASSAAASAVSTDATEDQLVQEAKDAIAAATGYQETENYLFIVENVEGETVEINVRENGEDVASSVGFYKYDRSSGTVFERDYLTNEYVEYPAE